MRTALVATFILLCSGASSEARDKKVPLRWDDLAPYVNGKKMSAVLADGTRVEGRAISVEPDGLAVMVARSSDKARFQGKSLLPRSSLSTIRTGHTGWKWKVIGPIAGFFGLGTLGAFLGDRADPDGFIISNGAAIGILAGVAIGVTAGVLIGRWADHHYTTIEIVP